MNRVPVARHGLTLGEDEATASRKLFRPLLGLNTAIKNKIENATTKQNSRSTAQRPLCLRIELINTVGSAASVLFISFLVFWANQEGAR